MKYEDEDMGYEMQRQARIDAQAEADLKHLGVVIGRDLKDCDKVQKFAHRDPAPELPFQEDLETLPSWWVGVLSIVAGLAILAVTLWGMWK